MNENSFYSQTDLNISGTIKFISTLMHSKNFRKYKVSNRNPCKNKRSIFVYHHHHHHHHEIGGTVMENRMIYHTNPIKFSQILNLLCDFEFTICYHLHVKYLIAGTYTCTYT